MLQRIWWLLPMGKEKIERETKREKRFSLGRNARGRRVQGIATFKKIAKEERVKGCRLREDSRGGESKVLLPLKEIISVGVCESKEKIREIFFSRETYTRIIVIDLIIMKLFGVWLVVFFLSRRKGFPRKFCVLVCDCYFGLLILLTTLFGTQQGAKMVKYHHFQKFLVKKHCFGTI